MDPANSIVWARKSFIGSLVSCRVGFSKTWVKNQQEWIPAVVSTISLALNMQPQGHHKQESTTFFMHMDPANDIVWARKSFIGSLVSCRVGFQQNLGQKSAVMDPSCCQHNFLDHQYAATGTSQTGINHFYSSIWIQKTALYGQGRVSLALWCRAGLVFSKTWVKNQQ
jgi:hypothetical protein